MITLVALKINAVVAELADAQDSGSCGRKPVEVQVLSTAPFSSSICGYSSEGEHHLDTVGAIGSIPISRTMIRRGVRAGRRSTTRNRVGGEPSRGFESHPLRHFVCKLKRNVAQLGSAHASGA